jgi:hypothetical protein
MAYVEVGESRIFKGTFAGHLNGNPILSKDQLTWIKVGILYMQPKLLTTINRDTMLNLGCDCGMFFFPLYAKVVIKVVDPTLTQ